MSSSRHLRSSSRVIRSAVGVLVCAVLVACGSDDSTETADTDPSTTDAPDTTSGQSSSTTDAAAAADVWRQNATEHRGENGERFTIDCPPGGTEDPIYGVETYTDDSSICTAAVHVGLITFEDGGEVEYEIAAGLDEYESATGHDVLSSRYPEFPGSFLFPAAPPGSGDFTLGPETWQRTAVEYRARIGEQFTYACAAGGPLRNAWGTGTYTDDSSVCTAAVHAGLITVDDGGSVTFEMAPGEDSYEGSTANGVTTSEYPTYPASFTFPDEQPDS